MPLEYFPKQSVMHFDGFDLLFTIVCPVNCCIQPSTIKGGYHYQKERKTTKLCLTSASINATQIPLILANLFCDMFKKD